MAASLYICHPTCSSFNGTLASLPPKSEVCVPSPGNEVEVHDWSNQWCVAEMMLMWLPSLGHKKDTASALHCLSLDTHSWNPATMICEPSEEATCRCSGWQPSSATRYVREWPFDFLAPSHWVLPVEAETLWSIDKLYLLSPVWIPDPQKP